MSLLSGQDCPPERGTVSATNTSDIEVTRETVPDHFLVPECPSRLVQCSVAESTNLQSELIYEVSVWIHGHTGSKLRDRWDHGSQHLCPRHLRDDGSYNTGPRSLQVLKERSLVTPALGKERLPRSDMRWTGARTVGCPWEHCRDHCKQVLLSLSKEYRT